MVGLVLNRPRDRAFLAYLAKKYVTTQKDVVTRESQC
jgi:hypothetical protein